MTIQALTNIAVEVREETMAQGKKDCWRCVYATRAPGFDITCNNKYVLNLKHPVDPYDCEFCDEVTDNYMDDMERVMDNT